VSDRGVLFTVTGPGGDPIRVEADSGMVSITGELYLDQMDIRWVWRR
jgi:hypothetical protein